MVDLENIREDLENFFSKKENTYKLYNSGYFEWVNTVDFRGGYLKMMTKNKDNLKKFLDTLNCDIIKKVKKDGNYEVFLNVVQDISEKVRSILEETTYKYPHCEYRITKCNKYFFDLTAVELADCNKEDIFIYTPPTRVPGESIWYVEQTCRFTIEYPFEVVEN